MSWTFTADDGEQVHYDVPPQVAELEDKLQKATDNYDSTCRQISFMAERMERFETLQAELAELKANMSDVDSVKRVKEFYDKLYRRREMKPEGVVREKLDKANKRIAELEADNRKLSEIEQRRISEAITQADSIAILREQLGNWRNGNE